MKAMPVWLEKLLNLKHNKKKLIEALSKEQLPDSIELLDENGKKHVIQKDKS